MELDMVADKEVDKVADMVAGHGCWLIGQSEIKCLIMIDEWWCFYEHIKLIWLDLVNNQIWIDSFRALLKISAL